MKFDKTLLIKNLTAQTEKQAKIVVDKVLSNIVEDLMIHSPVGQPQEWVSTIPEEGYAPGKYKANWQHSVVTRKTDVLDERDDSILAAECETADRLNASIKANTKLATTHYFTNNVPYAEDIEYGSAVHNPQSQSQPFAVAGLAVANIDKHIRRAMREVRK